MASDSMRTLLSVTLAGCFVKGTSVRVGADSQHKYITGGNNPLLQN